VAEQLLDRFQVALGGIEDALACCMASLVHPLAACLAPRDHARSEPWNRRA
jgi:hypothetical protein